MSDNELDTYSSEEDEISEKEDNIEDNEEIEENEEDKLNEKENYESESEIEEKIIESDDEEKEYIKSDDDDDEKSEYNSDDDNTSDDNDVVDENEKTDEKTNKNIKKKSKNIESSSKLENYKSDNDDSDDEQDIEDEPYLQKFNEEMNKNYILDNHPECLMNNYDEIIALTTIIRDKDNNIIDDLHKTIPYLTKYEKTRILGQRTKQINSGATVFVKVPENVIDGYLIAEMELQQKRIPFIIRRPIPGGGCEYWNLKDLELINF